MSSDTRKQEGENPFDQYLSEDTKQKLQEVKQQVEFGALQERVNQACKTSAEAAHENREHWARRQKREHITRLEQAEMNTPVRIQEDLLVDNDAEARLDDQTYGWITLWDELLQLQTDEEYLRARRSFERRLARAKETGQPIKAPWTSGRIGSFVGFVVVLWLSGYTAVDAGPISGLVVLLIMLPIWAMLLKLPSIFGDLNSGGGSRGSGSAV